MKGFGLLALSSLVAAANTNSRLFGNGVSKRQTTAGSSFNPLSASNLIVYYSEAQNHTSPTMHDLCTSTDVNVVVMGFIQQFNGPSSQPTFVISGSCKSKTNSTTTVTCPDLAANITLCQNTGKKVLISLGGPSGNLTLQSSSEAEQAADILWNVFGGGSNSTSLRPFGNVTLDGFDFDLENSANTSYVDVLAASLQSRFKDVTSSGYISAGPLCANNTALPNNFYAYANFVWPRFYDAQACCFGSKGFNNSLKVWYDYLGSIQSSLGSDYPRLYLGGLSFNNSISGYVDSNTFANDTIAARKATLSKFGGVSLWKGTDGLANTNTAGLNFLNITKAALDTPITSGASRVHANSIIHVINWGFRCLRMK